MSPRGPIDYERIRPAKRGRPYPFKCRRCGALATWKETFASRDRRHFRTPWCLCDRCLEATGGVKAYLIGKLYRETKKAPSGRADREFGGQIVCPPKTAERIAEQFNGPERETKRDLGENQYTSYRVGNNFPPKPTAERIAEQFNVSDRTVKNAEKFADAVDTIADTYGDEA